MESLSLGARPASIPVRILLPQVMPRLLDTTRLTLGAAWLFLIAADDFSDRRFGISDWFGQKVFGDGCDNSYVLWITFLGFVMDWFLRISVKSFFPWYETQR